MIQSSPPSTAPTEGPTKAPASTTDEASAPAPALSAPLPEAPQTVFTDYASI